ncbi:MAG: sulfatase-like hydrolase/transferase [Bacteroidota bacterium]
MKKFIILLLLVMASQQLLAQPFINEIRRFQKADSLSTPEKGSILLIGSSSFTKWQNVSDWFPGKRIVNRGFGGSSLPDLIRYVDQIVKPYDPIQILVYCGENDVASSTNITADTVLKRFKTLHGMIRKIYPKVRISFVSLKPSPVRASFLTTVKETNGLVEQFCKQSTNTDFIDVFNPMLNADGSFMEELFVSDRLHMNEKGYLIWKKAMDPFLMSTQTIVKKTATVKRPNIIWLSVEDMSPRLGCYGDATVPTPNIDRLAKQGVRFTNAFTTAGVCAPSRNAIITGRMQTSNGGHNMRTLMNTYPEQTGLPKTYSAVMPVGVKHLAEYLRAEGYYCTNNAKTDYQFEESATFWDANGREAHFRNRKRGQPFFAVFNSNTTHESQVWERSNRPLRVDPKNVKVPPIYPDTDSVRLDIARFYTNISEMDDWVGERIKELEEDGLLENTIVMFWSDHGDGLPYIKREVTDRGIRIPLVMRFPSVEKKIGINERLTSSLDFAPTVLSLAGIKPPDNMQGKAIYGIDADPKGHPYVFAASDRLDSEYDRIRSVHDGSFQYVYNFFPDLPRYMDIAYRKMQPTMRDILRLREAGKLNAIQARWFEPKGTDEEFYDVKNDPYQLHDLSKDPQYASQVERFRKVFKEWQQQVADLGGIQEKKLVAEMWNGKQSPPVTTDPLIFVSNLQVGIAVETPGASIAYKIIGKDGIVPDRWEVYKGPFAIQQGDKIQAKAQRIGYISSASVSN